MKDQQSFFTLLKYSNQLKKQNQYLKKKDPEAFNKLLQFLAKIEDNIHYSEKQEYIELAKDFLADQINADNFSYSFIAIYEGIGKTLGEMEIKESLELANFLKSNRPELGRLLARIYGSCDSYSLDPEIAMSDEKELKELAKSLLFKLQEE